MSGKLIFFLNLVNLDSKICTHIALIKIKDKTSEIKNMNY